MRTRWMWATWLVACGPPDLGGVWEGQCTVETANKGEQTYGLSYTLQNDGDAVTGGASVEAPFLTEPIDGTVTGTIDSGDDAVSLVAELGDPVLNFTLRHELTLDDKADTLTGPCSVQVQDEMPFDGESELARTGDLPEDA